MNINIKTTGLELTDALEAYLHEKLAHVEKFITESERAIARAEVNLAKTTQHHKNGDFFKAEITILLSGRSLHASANKDDLYAAIDEMQDEIISEIKRWHGKRHTLLRRGGRRIKNMLRSINPWKRQ
ncbi:MAG: ribosome-associated translation inhibitor RaiA [Patescibacteria group bacterium]